jgi:chemotaxis protein MotA
MNSKVNNAIIAFVAANLLVGLLSLGYYNSDQGSPMATITHLFGGKMPDSIVYIMMYMAFIYSMLEVFRMKNHFKDQSLALKMGLLPEKEQYVLSGDDVNDLKLKMVDMNKSNPSLLVELIKLACTKYRANKSVSETLSVVNSQTEINIRKSDSELNMIKYLGWAVQSLGLLGTVFGLSHALTYANQISTQDGVNRVTSFLGTAFNTTLVAVFLSIILMYFFTKLQNEAEKLHIDIESYVLENLINRIYSR